MEPAKRERLAHALIDLPASCLTDLLRLTFCGFVDLAALAATIEDGGVKLWGLQTEIDRIQKDIAALGAVTTRVPPRELSLAYAEPLAPMA